MSEYQSYEFLAIDHPLDRKAMARMRQLSTRATITPTRFSNTYQWGDFRGDVREMMRHYDAFLHRTNFAGFRELALRVPARSIDFDAVKGFAVAGVLAIERRGRSVVFEFTLDESAIDDFAEEEQGLAEFVPIRQEILRGDFRALYLAWCAGQPAKTRSSRSSQRPGGFGAPSGALRALAAFLEAEEILDELGSIPDPLSETTGLERLVRTMSAAECRRLLLCTVRDPRFEVLGELRKKMRAGGRATSKAGLRSRAPRSQKQRSGGLF